MSHPLSHPPSPSPPARSSGSRAHRSFWFLLALAVLATGALSSAVAAAPSPLTGLRVAASGLLLLGSLSLAARVRIALDRNRRKSRRTQT